MNAAGGCDGLKSPAELGVDAPGRLPIFLRRGGSVDSSESTILRAIDGRWASAGHRSWISRSARATISCGNLDRSHQARLWLFSVDFARGFCSVLVTWNRIQDCPHLVTVLVRALSGNDLALWVARLNAVCYKIRSGPVAIVVMAGLFDDLEVPPAVYQAQPADAMLIESDSLPATSARAHGRNSQGRPGTRAGDRR